MNYSDIEFAANDLTRLIIDKIEKNTTVIKYAVMENSDDLKMLIAIEEYLNNLEKKSSEEKRKMRGKKVINPVKTYQVCEESDCWDWQMEEIERNLKPPQETEIKFTEPKQKKKDRPRKENS